MTKLNLIKVEEARKELKTTLKGINSFSAFRDRIESVMSKIINPKKVKNVLNEEQGIEVLTDEEIISFFRILYEQLKVDAFNPKNLKLADPKKKGKIYNEDFKERFIEEHRVNGKPYAETTKRVIRLLFKKVGELEYDFGKDISEFNNVQFESALSHLQATTLRSLQNSISTIEQYIDFAIKENKIPVELGNIAIRYNKASIVSDFLDKKAEENMLYSKNEIDALSTYADNAQDGVILSLLFDGVSHKRQFLELRSIQIDHCNLEDLYIDIPDVVDESTGELIEGRRIPISRETAMMIRSAMSEKKYTSIKGESSREYNIAAESNYVLRGLRDNYQIKWENISQRLLRLAKKENYPYLNATTISYSGQIHYARELMVRGVDIDQACEEIVERFNINDNESAHFYLKGRIEKANRLHGVS